MLMSAASCIKCGANMGCSCKLIEGLCPSCYSNSKQNA